MHTNSESITPLVGSEDQLLAWYDIFGRTLPWRSKPQDPYHVYISEIMLQQTTIVTCIPYFERFISRFQNWGALADASTEEILKLWEGLGYYRRAHHMHACAKQVAVRGLPQTVDELLKLPGIGPYTARALAAILFSSPVLPIDGNIKRILSRFLQRHDIPSILWITSHRVGDVPQALMDLGSLICRPKNPSCFLCPLQANCLSYRRGTVLDYPAKKEKLLKPKRYGRVLCIINEHEKLWIEKRENFGLLAGLYQMPMTPWRESKENIDYQISHTFTHFSLHLHVEKTKEPSSTSKGFWISKTDLNAYAFPKFMHKAFRLCGLGLTVD